MGDEVTKGVGRRRRVGAGNKRCVVKIKIERKDVLYFAEHVFRAYRMESFLDGMIEYGFALGQSPDVSCDISASAVKQLQAFGFRDGDHMRELKHEIIEICAKHSRAMLQDVKDKLNSEILKQKGYGTT